MALWYILRFNFVCSLEDSFVLSRRREARSALPDRRNAS